PVGGRGLVQALEEPAAEGAAIDDRLGEAQAGQCGAVENAAPLAVAAAVELVGMLETQECLGLAITRLLPLVGTGRGPPVMPDKRAGSEGNPVAGLLQPPADIDIVACLAILRIETVDRLQGAAAKSHVASGNMLRHLVAFQDMRRLART